MKLAIFWSISTPRAEVNSEVDDRAFGVEENRHRGERASKPTGGEGIKAASHAALPRVYTVRHVD